MLTEATKHQVKLFFLPVACKAVSNRTQLLHTSNIPYTIGWEGNAVLMKPSFPI